MNFVFGNHVIEGYIIKPLFKKKRVTKVFKFFKQ